MYAIRSYYATSGKHTPHVASGTIMSNATCDACHVSTTNDGSTITGPALHANLTNDVTISGTYDSDANPANNYAAGSCNNVYCHSSGQATPAYKSVAWIDNSTGCNFCHNSGSYNFV